jgi:glycosyltransferase involved in cell wall biosynthesis
VGDAATLIGDTGFVVEIANDTAIADAVSTLLREPEEARQLRTRASRERICTLFSIDALARNTEQILLSLLTDCR